MALEKASGGGSSLFFFDPFSCNGTARLPNMTAAAARVALRRLKRWRQSISTIVNTMKTMPPRTPPTIAAVLLP